VHVPVRLAPQVPARVVVLASGAGSLFASLVRATVDPAHPVDVVALGTDRACAAVDVAAELGVVCFTVRVGAHPDRAAWDRALTEAVAVHEPHLVVCAGFMRVLGPEFLARFGGRTINTHPSLLPSFPGARAVADALSHGVTLTGSTVHLVDAGLDTGPILAQQAVPVLRDDDETSLHERIKVAERVLLVDVLSAVATSGVTTDGRKAQIP
jgi:phosphoribosylglycinamide formyltransferase-1